MRRRCTAEIRRLRFASDRSQQNEDASENITIGVSARKGPSPRVRTRLRRARRRRKTLNDDDLSGRPRADFRRCIDADRAGQPAGAWPEKGVESFRSNLAKRLPTLFRWTRSLAWR